MEEKNTVAWDQNPEVEDKKTNFISSDEAGVDALFDEFRELDFESSEQSETSREDSKTRNLKLFLKMSDVVFKSLLILLFITGIDMNVRSLEQAGILADMGLCSYLGMSVDVENTHCQTYHERAIKVQGDIKGLKTDITSMLDTFVEKKIQTLWLASNPEVAFIQKKINSGRVSFAKMSSEFEKLRTTSTRFQGKDIECTHMSMDEKGNVSIDCDFYWNGLNSGTEESMTARATALAFLEKMNAPGSLFSMPNPPKVLNLEKFTSSDPGVKGTFSTKTSLKLKFRFTPSNQL